MADSVVSKRLRFRRSATAPNPPDPILPNPNPRMRAPRARAHPIIPFPAHPDSGIPGTELGLPRQRRAKLIDTGRQQSGPLEFRLRLRLRLRSSGGSRSAPGSGLGLRSSDQPPPGSEAGPGGLASPGGQLPGWAGWPRRGSPEGGDWRGAPAERGFGIEAGAERRKRSRLGWLRSSQPSTATRT